MKPARVAGLVLAGGRGSRLGATVPKPLVGIGGRPMISYVLDRFSSSRIWPILIGANEPSGFEPFGHPVVPDRMQGFQGPLAALSAALAWLQVNDASATHLLCLPGDTPFLPVDVCARMMQQLSPRPRIASHAGQLHPTVMLWPVAALEPLDAHLAGDGDRSILAFVRRLGVDVVEFDAGSGISGIDPFFNVNTPDDLAAASAAASGSGL